MLIKKTMPQIEEKLSWGAPTYVLKVYCLQFAGYQKHLGFYTSPATIRQFQTDLKPYKTNEKIRCSFARISRFPNLLIKMIQFRAEKVEESP